MIRLQNTYKKTLAEMLAVAKSSCYNQNMQFDETFLQDMGLAAMPEEQKQAFLDYIQEELEVRVGERIAKGLTDEQLKEFDTLTDPVKVAEWLDKNRPDYHEIIAISIEEMKNAIRANRAKLI